MKITEKHRKLAELLWEDEKTNPVIAKELGISKPTIYKWQREPWFQDLLRELDAKKTEIARRVMLKHANRAAKALIKLTETRIFFKKDGKQIQKFIYNEETVRKACMNILETALSSGGTIYDQETIKTLFSLFFGLVWVHGGVDILRKIKMEMEKSPQLKNINFDNLPIAQLEAGQSVREVKEK